MRLILTALIFLFGLFDLFMGLNFLFNPAATATGFGLEPIGTQGLSTLRADFMAFFGVVAVCMMIGAHQRGGNQQQITIAAPGADHHAQCHHAEEGHEIGAQGRQALGAKRL